jgi:hypothetical protein
MNIRLFLEIINDFIDLMYSPFTEDELNRYKFDEEKGNDVSSDDDVS